MNINCGVIEDLIQLYADDLCSADSKTIVELHTAVCPSCKKKLEDAMEKTVINEEPIIKGLRNTRKHYLKLVIITLLICAALLIPIISVISLNINEKYGHTVSWSSIKAERNTKKFAKYIQNGEYEKASQLFEFDHNLDLDDKTLLRQIIVSDLKSYFEANPITKVTFPDTFYNNSGNIVTEVDFYTDSELYKCYEMQFITNSSGEFIISNGTGIDRIDDDFLAYYDDKYILLGSYERYIGIPRTNNFDFNSTNWLEQLTENESHTSEYFRYAIDQLGCQKKRELLDEYFSKGDASLWSEYKSKLDDISAEYDSLAELLQKYNYNSADMGEKTYKDEQLGAYEGYFTRSCTLGFDNFTVSFTLQNDGWGEIMIPESISYSGSVPEDFRTLFDEIFS